MDFKRTILASAIAVAAGGATFPATAILTEGTTLYFDRGSGGVLSCSDGSIPPCSGSNASGITDVVGSYFGMDLDASGTIDPNEKMPIGAYNGIRIGTIQQASGSHPDWPDGWENPDIDEPWAFMGATGMHQTSSPITVLQDGDFTKTLDFSGWGWSWNGVDIPMEDLGTTITCDTASCSYGSNFTIDGTFRMAGLGFTNVPYALHLEGVVLPAIPIPAAAWLFGSGLVALAGVARKRKSGGR